MSLQSVFCVASTRLQADRIVAQLRSAQCSPDDFAVLAPDAPTGPGESSSGNPTGSLLISVRTGNARELACVRDIFTRAGAADIFTTGDAIPAADGMQEAPSPPPEPFVSSVRYGSPA